MRIARALKLPAAPRGIFTRVNEVRNKLPEMPFVAQAATIAGGFLVFRGLIDLLKALASALPGQGKQAETKYYLIKMNSDQEEEHLKK